MIATFGNLDVGIVPGRELYSLRRNQAGVRVVRLRQVHVYRRHDFRQSMGAGNRQHLRMGLFYHIATAFGAEAARDDDLAVFRQSLADGIQGFSTALSRSRSVDDTRSASSYVEEVHSPRPQLSKDCSESPAPGNQARQADLGGSCLRAA